MKLRTRARHVSRNICTGLYHLLILLLCLLLAGCDGTLAKVASPQSPEPSPGLPDYQHLLRVNVFGGSVNVAGGNLFLAQGGFEVTTIFGPEEVGAIYNSATKQWRFGVLDSSFDGSVFVDPTGAEYDVTSVADGAVIPGTVWIKVDADTIRAKGGLIFDFDSMGQLVQRYRDGQVCPRILYESITPTDLQVRQEDCGVRGPSASFNTVLYTVTYDGQGNVVRVDASGGRTALYSYAGGQLLTARDPYDVSQGWTGFQYEYHPVTGVLTSSTNSEGERTEYEFISPFLLGKPRIQYVTKIDSADPANNIQYRFDYRNSAGGVAETLVTDTMGRTRRFAFDDSRRIRTRTWETVGESELFGYIGEELDPSSHTLANGSTESYTRDSDGNILTIAKANGNVVTHVYADANSPFPFSKALASTSDLLGTPETWTYTEDTPVDYKRLASWENGAGEVTQYEWHPAAEYTRLAKETSPSGITKEYSEFTPFGPAGQTVYGGSLATKSFFDATGNLTSGGPSETALGGIRSRSFNQDRSPNGAVVFGTDGVEKAISMTRGGDGRVLTIDRPPLGLGNGPDHRFSYNGLGRLEKREEWVNGVWNPVLYEIDGEGHLTAETLSNGMRREWDYDQRNRLTAFRTFRHGTPEGELTLTYVNGNLVSLNDSERGLEIYSHDSAGRRIRTQYAGGEATEYEYDLRSRLIRETFRQPGPDDAIIKEVLYAYNGANRQTQIWADGKLVLDRTFVDGQVDCTTTGNGLKRCFTYDPTFGLPRIAETMDANLQVIASTSVQNKPVGPSGNWEISSVTNVASLGTTVERYGLGPEHTLGLEEPPIGKRVLSWTNGGTGNQTYEYDALSNQQSDADGDLYAYNSEGNRLISATVEGESVTYSYDSAGFATARNGVPIEWTADGRMAAHGSVTATWDMFGKPLSVTDNSGPSTVYRDWSRWGGRIETDGVFLVVIALGSEVSLGFDGQERYRHLDFRGNVSWVSDENGAPIVLYEYSPYGVDSWVGDNSEGVNFVGKSQIGPFLLLGERMYDPLVGRFLSPDPVLNLLNQYTYTMGNPIWFSDADGRLSRTTQVVLDVINAVLIFGGALVLFAASIGVITIGTTLGIVLAGIGVLIGTIGLIASIDAAVGAPASSVPNTTGCGCTRALEFSIGVEDVGAAPGGAGPEGTAPAGSGGNDGNGQSGVVSSHNGAIAAVGSGAGGGIAGGSGGFAGVTGFGGGGCGLLGIEPFLVYALLWILRLFGIRRRRTC